MISGVNIRKIVIFYLAICVFLSAIQFRSTTAQTVETQFDITIVNKSNETLVPSPYSPGVWAVHNTADPLFTADTRDLGLGLEQLAEAGDPSTLVNNLSDLSGILASGTFTQPVVPGGQITFSITTDDPTAALSLASMLVASNDLFFAPDGDGIPLFNEDGTAVSGEVTDQIALWDAGTERNEVPGSGANQPTSMGGSGAETGAAERGVSPFDTSTRALPTTADIGTFSVTDLGGGNYQITLTNISGTSGAIDTPIAPLFYATHTDMWSLFTAGQPDSGTGLEVLAEDGDPSVLINTYADAFLGSGTLFVPNDPNINEIGTPAMPIGTGESQMFIVTASAAYPNLTVAAMVVQSNDAFLGTPPSGISLVDADGNPRSAADIESDLNSLVAVWDAGTEANETPGAGPNQPLLGGLNVGDPDPNTAVRLYQDSTNDLAAGSYFDLDITPVGGTTFRIELTNTSGGTPYQGALSPLFAAQHSDGFRLFGEGFPAGTRLQNLAENGSTASLITVDAFDEVSGVSTTSAPIQPGESHVLTVTMDAQFPILSVASMVVPSNDAFVAFDPAGITLLDSSGQPVTQAEIDTRIAESFIVWDAGTEVNQAGAAGPDQAGAGQMVAGQGASEGDGTVRLLDDPVYTYPVTSDMICVFITARDVVIEPTSEPTTEPTLPPTPTVEPTPTEPIPTELIPTNTPAPTIPPLSTMTPPTIEPTTTPFPSEMTDFIVTLINKSDDSSLPASLSAGVWAVHAESNPFFAPGTTIRTAGLEQLAEAGNPAQLFNALMHNGISPSLDQFDMPLLPGERMTFTVSAFPDSALSLATMLVPSNDLFFAPDGEGIPLFDENGDPIRGNVTDQIVLWDAGTEVNEAPFSGPNQPLNGGAEMGAAEGVVAPFTNSTRALPLAADLADFSVSYINGSYVITFTNVSTSVGGALDTPLSPLFFATHNEAWTLFEPDTSNRADGLEALAEDGVATTLVNSAESDLNTQSVGTATSIVMDGSRQQTFIVTPTADFPYLSVASMVVRSNDAFVALPEAVSLLRGNGNVRSPIVIERELNRLLAVWDAGTEANQVPGAGSTQPENGGGGAPDPDNTVRRYSDTTNDLAVGSSFFDLEIDHIEGTTFRVQLSNTSGGAFSGALSPIAIVQHNSRVDLFDVGSAASEPIRALAEDGNPAVLAQLTALTEVANVVTTSFPALPNQAHILTATMSAAHPSLNIFSMIVPSNDAFVAFPPEGITLVNPDGTAVSQAEIDAFIAESFIAWDAGTEANQSGASGPDQAGAGQTFPNQGLGEGSGVVRPYENAPYAYPAVSDLFCVLIRPAGSITAVTLAPATTQTTAVAWIVTAVTVLIALTAQYIPTPKTSDFS